MPYWDHKKPGFGLAFCGPLDLSPPVAPQGACTGCRFAVAGRLAVPGSGFGVIWVSLLAGTDRLPQRDQAQKTQKSALGARLQRGTKRRKPRKVLLVPDCRGGPSAEYPEK